MKTSGSDYVSSLKTKKYRLLSIISISILLFTTLSSDISTASAEPLGLYSSAISASEATQGEVVISQIDNGVFLGRSVQLDAEEFNSVNIGPLNSIFLGQQSNRHFAATVGRFWPQSPFSLSLFTPLNLTTAGVTILSPDDGSVENADLCPVAPCTKEFTFEVEVLGAPVDSVVLEFTPEGQTSHESKICEYDPIENYPACPDPPQVFSHMVPLHEGRWIVVARVTRGTSVESSTPIHLEVLPPTDTQPGPVSLSEVVPNRGVPRILIRDSSPGVSRISTEPDSVKIIGTNLNDNSFLEVYVAPIPYGEASLPPESGLPTADWCLFEATILKRGLLSGGESYLEVEIPELPRETSITCGVTPGPVGSIFTMNWRWVIRDPWIRDQREHEWWAIPSPRTVAWHDSPPFKMVKPAYPLINGFGFKNTATIPTYNEFLTVYGNNAYICVGALGVCLTRIPDPLYHLLWWPIYDQVVRSTGGSCNGMSSTSLLMAREELQTEDFNPAVHYPVGFDVPGYPSAYKDTNFCTPFCSPPKPDNLWATIRMNHGVQISWEFIMEVIETLGEAIFDPNDITSIKGVPNATLARVKSAPQDYVVCFFQVGSGHCVTPYRVDSNKIYIYDNNAVKDVSRYIEIVDGDYNYPARRSEPNHGNAIMAFPIDIWKNGRRLPGLGDLLLYIRGEVIDFLYMIAVGSGDMIVTNDAGGRWGWEEDGSFTDEMFGAVSIAPLGEQDAGNRVMPLLIAMNQPAPTVRIHADGGRYVYHTGAGGLLFQLEANALSGDEDRIRLGYTGGDLYSFDFTPQRDTSQFVPRIGLAIEEEESALFHWLGLDVPGGQSVGFSADKQDPAVTYNNDTGDTTRHMLALDYGSGSANSFGRMMYGPFEVPAGASQRVVLKEWPKVTEVVSEMDIDGDGTPDHTEIVSGRSAPPPLEQGVSTDLSVLAKVDAESVSQGEKVTYNVIVANAGPDDATEVMLVDTLPSGVSISSVTITKGTCVGTSGLSCKLGDLKSGEEAVVTYVVTPDFSGSLTDSFIVSGNEGDPDLTNNTSVAAAGSSEGKYKVYLSLLLR